MAEHWTPVPRYRELCAVMLACGHVAGPVARPAETALALSCRYCGYPKLIWDIRPVCRG